MFIYAISHQRCPEYVKMGRAKNLQNRLAAYNTSMPENFIVLHTEKIEKDLAPIVETMLKIYLSDENINGKEWYLIGREEAITALKFCCKMANKIFGGRRLWVKVPGNDEYSISNKFELRNDNNGRVLSRTYKLKDNIAMSKKDTIDLFIKEILN